MRQSAAVGVAGLTLVEVLVALVVLAVGISAAIGMQSTGLTNTRAARQVNEITALARSELDVWKASSIAYNEVVKRSCTVAADGCSVTISPCVVSGTNLNCSVSKATVAHAHLVEVSVWQDERSVDVATVVLP